MSLCFWDICGESTCYRHGNLSFSVAYGFGPSFATQVIRFAKSLYSDEVLVLKTRLLLKVLWLISYLLFSILLDIPSSKLAPIVLPSCTPPVTWLYVVVRRLLPTARHARYSTSGIIDSQNGLLSRSLWRPPHELGSELNAL
jgi:hypothetical protein